MRATWWYIRVCPTNGGSRLLRILTFTTAPSLMSCHHKVSQRSTDFRTIMSPYPLAMEVDLHGWWPYQVMEIFSLNTNDFPFSETNGVGSVLNCSQGHCSRLASWITLCLCVPWQWPPWPSMFSFLPCLNLSPKCGLAKAWFLTALSQCMQLKMFSESETFLKNLFIKGFQFSSKISNVFWE